MYYPLNYNQINAGAGTYSPSSVKSFNNKTFAYWERSLFQRAASVFNFTLPDNWGGKIKDFFIYCLYRFGFLAVSQNDKYGTFFQPCTLSGYNFYYQPNKCIISNPDYHAELEIGTECEILKLTPDYRGAYDIISYYAEKLSLLDNAINMSLINNKFAFILGAKNKSAAQAIKKILDKVNKGEPAVIYDSRIIDDERSKDTPFQFLERKDLKNSYLTTMQLMDFQTIINNFDAEIGIPTIPYQKKERMVSDEAQSRHIDSVSRITVWLNTLRGSIKEIKALYPDITLDVRLRDDIEHIMDFGGGDSNVME